MFKVWRTILKAYLTICTVKIKVFIFALWISLHSYVGVSEQSQKVVVQHQVRYVLNEFMNWLSIISHKKLMGTHFMVLASTNVETMIHSITFPNFQFS